VLGNEKCEEIVNLKKSDIEENGVMIKKSNDTYRFVQIPEKALKIIRDATKEDRYSRGNGETKSHYQYSKITDSEYVIRPVLRKDTQGFVDFNWINSKYNTFKKWTDNNYISPNRVLESGILIELYNIEQQRELTREDFKEVKTKRWQNHVVVDILQSLYAEWKNVHYSID
jgi:hypothetical protein